MSEFESGLIVCQTSNCNSVLHDILNDTSFLGSFLCLFIFFSKIRVPKAFFDEIRKPKIILLKNSFRFCEFCQINLRLLMFSFVIEQKRPEPGAIKK